MQTIYKHYKPNPIYIIMYYIKDKNKAEIIETKKELPDLKEAYKFNTENEARQFLNKESGPYRAFIIRNII